MKKLVVWFTENCIFGTLIWYGLFEEAAGAQNVLRVWVWASFALSFMCACARKNIPAGMKAESRCSWDGVKWAIESLFAGVLVWHGWVWTGIAVISAKLFVNIALSEEEEAHEPSQTTS